MSELVITVMKATTILSLLAGCDAYDGKIKPSADGANALVKYEDVENGVICYRAYGRDGISCVKVDKK